MFDLPKPPTPQSSDLLRSPQGSLEFGLVGADVAQLVSLSAGPIRLEYGIPGDGGYGYSHIQSRPDRILQLQRLGYGTLIEYIAAVGICYNRVCECKETNRLTLVYRHMEHDLRLIVQYNAACFWSVTTALPYRVCRDRILWERQADGSEPTSNALSQRPRFATLSLPQRSKGSEP